jgi:hypothetical protein
LREHGHGRRRNLAGSGRDVLRLSRASGTCDKQAAQNRSAQELHTVSIHLFRAVAKVVAGVSENPDRRE